MTMSTANQAYIFLATVYAGMLLGLIYDVYRAFRMIIKPGKYFVAILDFSFWILATFLSFFIFFRVNGGEIRFYAFIGLALGWGLYVLIIDGITVKLLVKVYEIISGIITWPIKKIIKAGKWLVKMIPNKGEKSKEDKKDKKNKKC